jgi:DNA-binding NarL/FixJ family response regulator
VVGEASTAAAARKGVELAPDLVIMDVHLPDGSGVAATREILAALPATKVIMLSSDNNRSLVDEALHAGACGFIWKQGVASELLAAIEMVMAGRLYLSPELTAGILEDYRSGLGVKSSSAKPRLTARDKDLLKLVAEGHRNKEIAAQMLISPKSVEAYRSRLMKKLGCHSPADLVRFAIREGIISA